MCDGVRYDAKHGVVVILAIESTIEFWKSLLGNAQLWSLHFLQTFDVLKCFHRNYPNYTFPLCQFIWTFARDWNDYVLSVIVWLCRVFNIFLAYFLKSPSITADNSLMSVVTSGYLIDWTSKKSLCQCFRRPSTVAIPSNSYFANIKNVIDQ